MKNFIKKFFEKWRAKYLEEKRLENIDINAWHTLLYLEDKNSALEVIKTNHTPFYILEVYANDSLVEFRKAVVNHNNTIKETLELMVNDETNEISEIAQHRLINKIYH
jgi:hypothetical protein